MEAAGVVIGVLFVVGFVVGAVVVCWLIVKGVWLNVRDDTRDFFRRR